LINPSEESPGQFRPVILFAFLILVVAPLIYFFVAFFVKVPLKTGGEQEMLFYILLLVGMVQPIVLPFLEKMQVGNYRKSKNSSMSPVQLYTTISIIKMAMIEAVYLYGLVVYFLSGDLTKMLYFYPVGIIWTLIYWPRRDKYEKFTKSLEGA